MSANSAFPNSVAATSNQLKHDSAGSAIELHWLEKLLVEGEALNSEHHALLEKLNDLLIAIRSGDRSHIVMACTSLAAQARAHFATEEALMRKVGYPDLESHREQHEELGRRLARLSFLAGSGSGFLSETAPVSLLEQWFVPHLTFADRRLADFMAAQEAASRVPAGLEG
jgi:hemerythrin